MLEKNCLRHLRVLPIRRSLKSRHDCRAARLHSTRSSVAVRLAECFNFMTRDQATIVKHFMFQLLLRMELKAFASANLSLSLSLSIAVCQGKMRLLLLSLKTFPRFSSKRCVHAQTFLAILIKFLSKQKKLMDFIELRVSAIMFPCDHVTASSLRGQLLWCKLIKIRNEILDFVFIQSSFLTCFN